MTDGAELIRVLAEDSALEILASTDDFEDADFGSLGQTAVLRRKLGLTELGRCSQVPRLRATMAPRLELSRVAAPQRNLP